MTKRTKPRRRKATRKHISGVCFTKHRATGQGYFLLEGQRHYVGRYDDPDTARRARRFILEYAARDGQTNPPGQDEITVAELVARYWRHAERYYTRPDGSPTSELSNVRAVCRPLIDLYEDTPARDFGPLALKVVRERMIRGVGMRHPICRDSVNKHVHRIRRIFRWGVSEELIAPSVYEALRAVPGLRRGRTGVKESKPVRPVPEKHVDAIRPHVSRQVWAAVQLQLLTAARPGEILGLRPMDIDRSAKVWTAKLGDHKTAHHGHRREIFFGPRAQRVLRQFLLRPKDRYLFSPAEAERDRRKALHDARTTPLHYGNAPGTNRKENPERKPKDSYDVPAYRRAISRACRTAGISVWTPHRLRHSAATCIRREFGLEVASIICGHKSLVVTQTYAEANRAKALKVMAEVG